MAFTPAERSHFIALLLQKGWEFHDNTIWSPTGGLWFEETHFRAWTPTQMHDIFAQRSARIAKAQIESWQSVSRENEEASWAAKMCLGLGSALREQDFWWELRCLINSRNVRDNPIHAKLGYCDSFEVRRWVFDPTIPEIRGRVGFVNGANANDWNFILTLAPGTQTEEQILWNELLPPAPEGDWLKFDAFHKTLSIETVFGRTKD